MTSVDRIIRKLQRDNPELTIGDPGSGSHYKLYVAGKLVGILPTRLAKEGLSRNLASQLRRGGVRL
jgi:hypothetical protein